MSDRTASRELTELQDAYEHSPCGLVSFSLNGRITRANTTFCRLIGYSQSKLAELKFEALLSMGGKIFYQTHLFPLLRVQGGFQEVALKLVAADGTQISALVSANAQRSDAGEVELVRLAVFHAEDRRKYEQTILEKKRATDEEKRRLVGTNLDLVSKISEAITERLQVEQGLDEIKAKEEAAQISLLAERETAELREQFIAVLGHDLRNPLASLVSGIELVRRTHDDSKTDRVATLMLGATRRMQDLISNVMDFARGRLGAGLTLDSRKIDLAPVIEQVVSELEASNPNHTFASSVEIGTDLRVDGSRFSQMLSNLIGNAVSYGSVEKPITISAKAENGLLAVFVANAGEPIPADTLPTLFQPFIRANRKSNKRGLGLGLYIASEIAKAHGGTLAAESSVEETRFTFLMPFE